MTRHRYTRSTVNKTLKTLIDRLDDNIRWLKNTKTGSLQHVEYIHCNGSLNVNSTLKRFINKHND